MSNDDIRHYTIFSEPSFVSSFNGILYTTYRPYLTCEKIVSLYLDPKKAYYPNIDIVLNNYAGFFQLITHITIIIFDKTVYRENGFYNNFPFVRFQSAFRSRVNEDHQILLNTFISNLLYGQFTGDFLFRTSCEGSYVGETCWFQCVNNTIETCACPNNTLNVGIECIIECKDGFVGLLKSYLVENHRELILTCNTIDLCYKNTQCVYTCLPIDNYSYFCENIVSAIISDISHLKNITSELFFQWEILYFSIDETLINDSRVLINTTVFLDIEADYFYDNTFKRYTNDSALQVVKGFYDSPLEYSLIFHLGNWNRYFRRNFSCRIYVRPSELKIYRYYTKELIIKFIYLGDEITCNSTAQPDYLTVTIWTNSFNPNSIEYGNTITISENLILKPFLLSCNVSLITSKREIQSGIITINVFPQAFIYFDWNNSRDILTEEDVVMCQAILYPNHSLTVEQLNGLSFLNIDNNTIYLTNISGGSYKFYCFLDIIQHTAFIKFYSFYLRTKPSRLCFFLYANTIGSVIQCGHNGYLQDEYSITVNYYELEYNKVYILKLSNINYVKIPFEFTKKHYKIKCFVENIFDNEINNTLEVESTLLSTTEHIYAIDEKNMNCLIHGNYVEEPVVKSHNIDSITLYHLLFHLKMYFFSIYFSILWIMICILLLYICIAVLVLVIYFQHIQIQNTLRACAICRKRVQWRQLNDRLMQHVDKCINHNLEISPRLFNRKFITVSSSISQLSYRK